MILFFFLREMVENCDERRIPFHRYALFIERRISERGVWVGETNDSFAGKVLSTLVTSGMGFMLYRVGVLRHR